MKALLAILSVGTVAFMLLAIGQEWSFFSTSWFGTAEAPAEMSEPERRAAADAVHRTLTLATHLYRSGGDRRYSERMPASEVVVEEMVDDIRYLGRRHLVQEASLEKLDVMALAPLGAERVEVRTRELWVVRLLDARTREARAAPERHVVRAKYLVARVAQSWRVEGWDLAEDATGAGAE